MNTSYSFAIAALKIRSMFSTVPFSVTLAPIAPSLPPSRSARRSADV
jgi:hypothetical protein